MRGQPWVSGVVLRRIGSMMYIVELNDGTRWKRHIDQLKKRYSEENTLDQESEEMEHWGPPSQNIDRSIRITPQQLYHCVDQLVHLPLQTISLHHINFKRGEM